MFYTLMRRIGVMTHACANPRQFICSNAGADAAAANENSSFGPAIQHRPSDCLGKVWIIGRVFVESADIQYLVPERAEQIAHRYLQLKPGVVRTNDNLHGRLTFRGLLLPRPLPCPPRCRIFSANP